MPRGNKENLKAPSTEEARVRGRKGGKASGKARRKKKEMRELFQDLLDMPMRAGKLSDAKTLEGLNAAKNLTVGQKMALAVLTQALDGDVRAAEFVRDTSGQKPVQQMEVSANAKEASAAFKSLLDEVDSGEG
jgi:hypothetical protein